MKLKVRNNKGFTLIELIITIAILALVSGVMVANFRKGEKAKRVQLTIDGVTNVIRLAQNYTLAGKQIQRSSGCSGDNTIADYRVVVINSSSIISLYADDKCGAAVLVDQFTLPARVQLKSNGVAFTVCPTTCTTTNANRLEVKFTPPFGKMTGSTNGTTFSNFSVADVTYQSNDAAVEKVFRIDGVSGRIGN